jgi:hypothetical protein
VRRVEGVFAVPRSPADVSVDRLGVPSSGVTLGEASASNQVSDIDQAHDDAIQ